MKKSVVLLVAILFIGLQAVFAQTKTITGTVTSEDGEAIPGVAVMVKGTTVGSVTNFDGVYSIKSPADASALIFSFVGMETTEVAITGSVLDVVLKPDSKNIDEVVVTALGISRAKKSLGYAVTEIGGDAVSETKETNVVNSLSGKVAGVEIKQASTMGGSANIVIRGSGSILGNNQALFVVDGVPYDNSNTNSTNQTSGWGGYDYGNAASDINPEDIESVSVLKGAAASALYGSRAANGVVLITTKSGKKKKGLGITINSSVTFSTVDYNTLPEMQQEYGAGYANYWTTYDFDGDGNEETVVNTMDDASYGPKYDEGLQVVHWDALDPNSDNYGETRPWTAPENDVKYFFETGVKYVNSVAFEGATDVSAFRFSYTNSDETGILPNSSIKKNSFALKANYKLNDKLKVSGNATYTNTHGKGRYGTGYSEVNPMQGINQWWQTNLDFKRMKEGYKTAAGEQRTWNANGPTDLSPAYTNNPYWERYENYEEDERNRLIGLASIDWEINDVFTLTGRSSIDYYFENQDERAAVGSNQQSYFSNYRRSYSEINGDLILKFAKKIDAFDFNGLAGANYRSNMMSSIFATTSGGLVVPGLYSVSNTTVAKSPTEVLEESNRRSVYANASVGYNQWAYIEGSIRVDESSTLPSDNNPYYYPAVSGSVILSELEPFASISALSFAKVRANYAKVGNDTDPYRTRTTYYQGTNWGDLPIYSVNSTLQNPTLKNETTKSWEVGLEGSFLNDRVGFDVAYYKSNTLDQIMGVDVTNASGYNYVYVNSGEVENKGIEASLNLVPVETKDFRWNIGTNWYKNQNKVLSLYNGVDNVLLASYWDVSLNAYVGEEYGTLRGTDFIYTNGKKTVDENGYYMKGSEEKKLGSIQPDWKMGISNGLSYKGINLKFLIDIQKGGDVYSTDRKYGLATGVYKETAGLNDKGNPVRDAVSNGGGIRFTDAVKEDGSANDIYARADQWGTAFYYGTSPVARYIYDASYVKLRELSLSYNLPASMLENTFFNKASVSFVGRNLWIIHKNTPGFDPETGFSSGNKQGITSAVYPTARNFGFNITLGF